MEHCFYLVVIKKNFNAVFNLLLEKDKYTIKANYLILFTTLELVNNTTLLETALDIDYITCVTKHIIMDLIYQCVCVVNNS